MDRYTWVLLSGVSLGIVSGCSSSTAPGDFQSYKELAAKDAATVEKTDKTPVEAPSVAEAQTPAEPVPEVVTETVDVSAVITPVSALAPVNVVDGTSMAAVLKVFPSPTDTPKPTVPASTLATASAEPKPGGIQLLVPNREFKHEGPQNALRVSYDDLDLLKVLNMEPVPDDALKHFPSWLKSLDGQRVRLRGFMYPTFQASGIDQFVLARDNQICCFGRNPKVYDLVSVQMRDNVTTDYIQNRPFDVVGTFRIDLVAEGGKPMGLYWLEDSVVINK